jgi:hypothetical protein
MTYKEWISGLASAAVLFTFAFGALDAQASAAIGAPASSIAEPVTSPDSASTEAGTGTQVDDGDGLLQQGLTIHEIDKEVGRLKQEESKVNEEIKKNEAALIVQEEILKSKRDSAGRVLRAYYMGDRDHLWLLLFQLDSINDMMVTFEYLNAVVRNDFRVLRAYRAEYEERLTLLAQQKESKERLQTVIDDYLRQRDRLVALQADLDRKLAQLTAQERDRRTEQIAKLATQWESEGLPLFRTYLAELGNAMKDISELLSEPSRLTLDGADLFVRLTEKDFNDFLQSKSKLFRDVAFRFSENKVIIASGTVDPSKQATIEGEYVLEEEPENLLRFHILSLNYNGFTLPDTTNKSLEQQFDLSFKPSLLFAGLKASKLTTTDGLLEVKLNMTGFPLALGGE